MNGLCQRLTQRRGLARRLGRASQFVGETAALQVLHAEKGLSLSVSHLDDLHDPGMLQPSQRLRVPLEADQIFAGRVTIIQNHLDGNEALRTLLPGLVNNAHAPAAEDRQNLVAWDPGQVLHRSACRTRLLLPMWLLRARLLGVNLRLGRCTAFNYR